jgi:hypothetical protein
MSPRYIEVFASNEDPNSARQARVVEEVPVVWTKLLREMQLQFRQQGFELHQRGEFEYAKLAGEICEKLDWIIDQSMFWAVRKRNERVIQELDQR